MEIHNLPENFPINSEKIEEILKWYISYYKEHSVENTELYPNVKSVLEFCKNKNIRLSVVSNKPAILSKKILSLFQIDSYFDCIIGPEDTGKTKPAPDGLALAVELMNKNCKEKISLTEILMVGDSYYDIQAGKNLGCLTCGILGGYGKIVKGEKFIPDYYLDYVGELNSILC
jgi:pyrophosphatase PpaX